MTLLKYSKPDRTWLKDHPELDERWPRSDLHLREATPEEAALLSALALESKAHWRYGSEALEKWRTDLTVTSTDVANHSLHVADSEGDPVGFYMLCAGDARRTLEHLWVRPRWMRRGVGSQLLRHALRVAFAGGASCVDVVSDPNAARFYEGQGGRRVGAIAAPLPDDPGRILPVYEFDLRVEDGFRAL